MKNLRKEFPVLSQYTYLNTASSGLLYDKLLEYRQDQDLDFLLKGSLYRDNQAEFLNSVRKTIAKFCHATDGDVVLIPNFSMGFNILLNGFKRDQKILLLEEDYPSINFAVASKRFDVYCAKIDENVEENIVNAINEHRPEVFAFSLVQYSNGIAIDLNFIKQLKAEYPEIVFIADGTQFFGTQIFDFQNSGIDIVGCSGYKWLLGGYGNGFLLFNNNILEKTTSEKYLRTARDQKYPGSYTSLSARFEPGHLDTFNFGSLQCSLNYLTNIGLANIQNHLQILREYTKLKLTEKGLLVSSVWKRNYHSSIFAIPGDQKLFETLKNNQIITTFRNEKIRISLHFYNTKEEIDHFLSYLS